MGEPVRDAPGTPGTVVWDLDSLDKQLRRAVQDAQIAEKHLHRCQADVARWRRLLERAREGETIVTRIP